MNRCPICHARFSATDILEDKATATSCSRCGTDLHLLLALYRQSAYWLQQACYNFINNQYDAALRCVQQSQALYFHPVSRYLLLMIQHKLYPCVIPLKSIAE